MLYQKDWGWLKKKIPFVVSLVYQSGEYEKTAPNKTVNVNFSDTVAIAIGNMKQWTYSNEEVHSLEIMAPRLKKIYLAVVEESYVAFRCILKPCPLIRMVEKTNTLDAICFKQRPCDDFNKQLEKKCRSTLQRGWKRMIKSVSVIWRNCEKTLSHKKEEFGEIFVWKRKKR